MSILGAPMSRSPAPTDSSCARVTIGLEPVVYLAVSGGEVRSTLAETAYDAATPR